VYTNVSRAKTTQPESNNKSARNPQTITCKEWHMSGWSGQKAQSGHKKAGQKGIEESNCKRSKANIKESLHN